MSVQIGDKNVKEIYVGVDGKARKVKEGYVGVGGGVKRFYTTKPSRLPNGYTEVKYIQSSGTQYINTGRPPSGDTVLTMDVETLAESAPSTLFCQSETTVKQGLVYIGRYFCLQLYSSGIRAAIGSRSGSSSSAVTAQYKLLSADITPRRMLITVDCPNKIMYIDGEEQVSIGSGTLMDMPALLLLGGESESLRITAKLYSVKITDSGKSMDFVPCTNPSGEVGLYDLVEGKFYANAGSGSFVAGRPV